MRLAITTVDNPYDPIKDFEHWFLFDVFKGYNTCSYLARIATTSDQLSDYENDVELEHAIDEIVKFNPLLYKKIKQ